MNRLRADATLLFVAVIWGSAFVAQKIANETMGPITFVGARFLISALVILPLVFYEARKHATPPAPGEMWIAGLIGLCLFTGAILQQIALVTTSASNGGFLTALYVGVVPFTTWILTRERVRPIVVVACIISITGAWILSGASSFRDWVISDILLVISDFAWALCISLIAIFLRQTARPFLLAFTQFAITAAIAIPAGLLIESVSPDGIWEAMPAILYAGLVSGGIAFTLQIVAQQYTPAPEAALIMSLESVFAVVAGAALLGERLTLLALAGCTLILLGVVVAEGGPAMLRRISPGASVP